MDSNMTTIIEPSPQKGFVETKFVEDITDRALNYINTGFPVHFRGRAGTGKTTLAMHLAHKIGKQVVLIHGDEEFKTSDLIGGEYGYHVRKVVDNFIHSVLKTEENVMKHWADNRLTIAVKYGFTLIYDEFTRSRPETNNILLPILEEHILNLPSSRNGEHYIKVDPSFKAIFTSNPDEYAGTHETQEALRDRMITIDLDRFDKETEIAITISKSNIQKNIAKKIVALVRELRSKEVCEIPPTIRACIMIAKVAASKKIDFDAKNSLFQQTCQDILVPQTSRYYTASDNGRIKNVVNGLIDKYFTTPRRTRKKKRKKQLSNKSK